MKPGLLPIVVISLSLVALFCSKSSRYSGRILQDNQIIQEWLYAQATTTDAGDSINVLSPGSGIVPAAAPVSSPVQHRDQRPVQHRDQMPVVAAQKINEQPCDVYSPGSWVRDESFRTFQPFQCPFVDPAFRCQENGRPDSDYLKWRWQPRDCELPRFNATDMLWRLRNKTLLFVGDSLGRNQWESLVCMLYQGGSNRNNVVRPQHRKVTKSIAAYSIKFTDYNVEVRFARSNFLVLDKYEAANMDPDVLWLDRVASTRNGEWEADIIVFNSGHWWNHAKIIEGQCSFIEGENTTKSMEVLVAFEKAMVTWSRWVDTHITMGKRVYFRGFSPNHFRGGDWNNGGGCSNFTRPEAQPFVPDEKLQIVHRVLAGMKTPVTLLNITELSDYRIDGHVGGWGSPQGRDCSHWCLPGVPDVWNELLYASLLS